MCILSNLTKQKTIQQIICTSINVNGFFCVIQEKYEQIISGIIKKKIKRNGLWILNLHE